MNLNLVPQQTPASGSRAESDQYPQAFSCGLAGSLPLMSTHAPRPDVVIVNMKSSPTSLFSPTEINGKTHHFLIDSGASKSVISKEVYDGLPESKPPIHHTNVRFQIANGSVNRVSGVCHLPLQLRFGNIMKSLCLPVFIWDFLRSKVNCIFGIDAGRSFKFVHCYDTGTMWFPDYPDQTPLVCIPKVIPQEDSYYARVLKRVVIKPQSCAPVEVGTCNSMPPHK